MTRTAIAAVAFLILTFTATAARADLCPDCKGKAYIMSVGQCTKCGGTTASGAFQLCADCSKKLALCEHCMAPLVKVAAPAAPQPGAADKPAQPPATQPAAPGIDTSKSGEYTSGPWTYKYIIEAAESKNEYRSGDLFYNGKRVTAAKLNRINTPWGVMQYFGAIELSKMSMNSGWLTKTTHNGAIDQKAGKLIPSPKAAELAKQLKEDLQTFHLVLHYYGDQDKPYYSLTLSVNPIQTLRYDPFHPIITITKEEAGKIVDHLATEGYLDSAIDSTRVRMKMPEGPAYALSLNGGKDPGNIALFENLGWGKTMIRRLESFKTALDGESAKSLQTLIDRLGPAPKDKDKIRLDDPVTTQPADK